MQSLDSSVQPDSPSTSESPPLKLTKNKMAIFLQHHSAHTTYHTETHSYLICMYVYTCVRVHTILHFSGKILNLSVSDSMWWHLHTYHFWHVHLRYVADHRYGRRLLGRLAGTRCGVSAFFARTSRGACRRRETQRWRLARGGSAGSSSQLRCCRYGPQWFRGTPSYPAGAGGC